MDLGFTLSVTRQAIPGPLDLDTSSFEEVTRADYAEPLQLDGFLNLDIHRRSTNGVQNNRFEVVDDLWVLSNL